MKNVSLIIPAYKPDEKLLNTIADAQNAGFDDVIIIDDGSGKEFENVFSKVEQISCCTLLRHDVNKGKGAAMKTAFAYFLENRSDGIGVITADADGQHLTKDIIATAQKMKESGCITLGCRDFTAPQVPPRSKFGNRCTIGVFKLFFGMKISDTQTGLRAFPKDILPKLLEIKGDRYEYETNMLFFMSRNSIPFEEVVIDTVYIDDNSSSHFRVVRDSLRIYGLIIKYLLSSLSAAVVDAVAFYLLKEFPLIAIPAIPQTYTASIIARIISSLVNYIINAKVVFGGKAGAKTLVKYYVLSAVQILVSSVLVYLFEYLLKYAFGIDYAITATAIKMVVDTVLFFVSFRLQHKWVFNTKDKKK